MVKLFVMFIFLLMFILIPFSSSASDFSYNRLYSNSQPIDGFNYSINVNHSIFTDSWFTNIGLLTGVDAVQHNNVGEVLTISEVYLRSFGNGEWLELDGGNSPSANINWGGFGINNLGSLDMVGDINMVGNDLVYGGDGSSFNTSLLIDGNTAGGDSTLVINSEINMHSCINLTEGSGTLGFQICNDGSGTNRLVFSNSHDGQEWWWIDRDAGTINLLNTTYVTGDLLPGTTLTYDIGSGPLRWRNIYATNLSIDNIEASQDITALGDITANRFIGDGANLTNLNVTGLLNVTGDFTGYAINISFLLGANGIGGIDMRGDPWWFSGADFQIATNLFVDNNVSADLFIGDGSHLTNVNETDPSSLHINQDNWENDSFDWIYWDAATPKIVFNQSKLETIFFNATVVDVVTGTGAGTLADIQSYDNIPFNVSEDASDFEIRVNFSVGVGGDFNQLIIRYKSAQEDLNHVPSVQIYDYDGDDWENYGSLPPEGIYHIVVFGVFDSDEHVDANGIVQVRIVQDEGVPPKTHIHNFDWVTITKGFGTPSGDEVDPFAIHSSGDVPWMGNENGDGFNSTGWNWISANFLNISGENLNDTFFRVDGGSVMQGNTNSIGFNSTYDWITATNLNITDTAYIGELTWNGNLDLGGNNLTNVDWINGFNQINGSGDINTTGDLSVGTNVLEVDSDSDRIDFIGSRMIMTNVNPGGGAPTEFKFDLNNFEFKGMTAPVDTAGYTFLIQGSIAGAESSSGTGKLGGPVDASAGVGGLSGIAGADNEGGVGGRVQFFGGIGGAAALGTDSNIGGEAGGSTILGGIGGEANGIETSTNLGGKGGIGHLQGGTGGAASYLDEFFTLTGGIGGEGGEGRVAGGQGGGSGTNGQGGDGGDLIMFGGLGGLGGGGTDGDGGDVFIDGGTGEIDGDIYLGNTTGNVFIGNNLNVTGNITANRGNFDSINVTGNAYIGELTWNGNLDLGGNNITDVDTGFFGWLGSLASRITKLWVQEIDVSGDLNVTGNAIVGDRLFLGNGASIGYNATCAFIFYNQTGSIINTMGCT